MPIFANYNDIPEDYVPDNRIRFLRVDCDQKDAIVIGGSTMHAFVLDGNANIDTKDIFIYYKQGSEIKLIKDKPQLDIEVVEESGSLPYSIIGVNLSPKETSLFNDYNKDLELQMKLILVDDSVIYTCIYKLRTVRTLDASEGV